MARLADALAEVGADQPFPLLDRAYDLVPRQRQRFRRSVWE